MSKTKRLIKKAGGMVILLLCFCACAQLKPEGLDQKESQLVLQNRDNGQDLKYAQDEKDLPEENTMINLNVNGIDFEVVPADTAAAKELIKDLQKEAITLQLKDYGGFEKVGSLQKNYSAADQEIYTEPGDIMLYNQNQIVLFYGNNQWDYTPLGKVSDPEKLGTALGPGDITITLSLIK